MWVKKVMLVGLFLLAIILGGAIAAMEFVLNTYLPHKITQALPPHTGFDYQTARLSPLANLSFHQVSAHTQQIPAITADRVTLYTVPQLYNMETFPELLQADIEQVLLPFPDFPVADTLSTLGYQAYAIKEQVLKNLGYARIIADITIKTRLQDEKPSIHIFIDAKAWGKLRLNLSLNKIPPPQQWQQRYTTIEVAALEIAYEDVGLLPRLFSHLSRRQGQSLDIFKQSLINQLSRDLRQAGLRIDQGLLDSLFSFIKSPKVMLCKVTPTRTLYLGQLLTQAPYHLFNQLSVQLTTQEQGL